jgi:hypothetical protein
MANVMTDQLLGTLLGSRPPGRGATDEELLEALTSQAVPMAPDPVAEPTMVAPPEPAVASQSFQAGSAPMPRVPSRTEQLMNTLQRPGSDDGVIAGVLDSLVGGDKWTSELRARRNMFDQAMLGAQAADVSSEERAAEAELGRGMQRDQMALTQRGQDLADKRAEEQRKMQEYLLGLRLGATSEEKEKDRLAALERAKLGAHHKGAGGPQTPEAKAEAENIRLSMEAAHLVRVASAPGKPAPYTQSQAFSYLKGEPVDLPPEVLAQLELERSTLAGMRSTDQKKYADMITAAAKSEASSTEGLGKGRQAKVTDPIRIEKARNELLAMRAPINDANASWGQLSNDAKEILVQYGGAGENALLNALKTRALKPEEQVAAARIQRVVNEDIKRFAGSAVTGSEWTRQAAAMGLPAGDFDPWKSPAVLKDYLRKVTDTYRALKASSEATYEGLWDGFEMPKPAGGGK